MEIDVTSGAPASPRRVGTHSAAAATTSGGGGSAQSAEVYRWWAFLLDVEELPPDLGHGGGIEDRRDPFQVVKFSSRGRCQRLNVLPFAQREFLVRNEGNTPGRVAASAGEVAFELGF